MLDKISEQFKTDGIAFLRFYFADGKYVKATQLLISDEKNNIIHVFGGNREYVIPVDKILYYEVYEQSGAKAMPGFK